jgi:plasmid maintenance system antidote protein VapI
MAKTASTSAAGKTPAAELQKQIDKFGLSKNAVSKALGLNPTTLIQVLSGKKKVDIELSLLFGKYFGNGEAVWIELQRKAGLADAKQKLAKKLSELKKAVPVKEEKKSAVKVSKAPASAAKRGPKAAEKKTDDKKPLRKVVRRPKVSPPTPPNSSIFN